MVNSDAPIRSADRRRWRASGTLVGVNAPPPGSAWSAQPTVAVPTVRKRGRLKIVLLSVTGLLVLCCGGLTAAGLIVGEPPADVPGDRVAAPGPAGTPTVGLRRAVPIPLPTSAGPSPSPPASSSAPPRRRAVTRRAAPERTSSPTRRPAARPAPRPKPRPTKTKRPPAVRTVHPGAFCAPVGARGVTKAGTPMRCTRKAGEERARWRRA